VGAFSYSHGLEWLVEAERVKDRKSLVSFLGDVLVFGAGRNDAIVFANAHRAAHAKDMEALREISELALAFSSSAERKLENVNQGVAFAEVTRNTWTSPTLQSLKLKHIAYPVAVAIAAADHDLACEPALNAYIYAFAANIISAGVRLAPLGHSDGQRALIDVEPLVAHAAVEGLSSTLADLGNAAVLSDIASMKHETQYTRLFRS
jgi:urease accessory protein